MENFTGTMAARPAPDPSGGRLVRLKDVLDLMEKRCDIPKSLVPLAPKVPHHGSCCCCQKCGRDHEDCVCQQNELLAELMALPSAGVWSPPIAEENPRSKAERDLLVAWDILEGQIAGRPALDLSVGIEYSSVVDWVVDITPRRGHPKARQYGEVWRGQGFTLAEAIMRAVRVMDDEMGQIKETGT